MAQKKFKFLKHTVDVFYKDPLTKNTGKGGRYYDWINEPKDRTQKPIFLWHGTPN